MCLIDERPRLIDLVLRHVLIERLVVDWPGANRAAASGP
jgi:hypothetical protein